MKMLALAASLIGLAVITTQAVAQTPPAGRTDHVRVVFIEPKEARHHAIRAAMQEHGVLDALAALMSAFRLPRELTIEVKGCDGREGAYYANDKAVFCYEYAELIQRHTPKVATPGGVTRDDANIGGILDTILHEVGHAVIDMLDLPVLGREEDAADFFSVFLQLQFPPDDARRLIEGVAFMMGSEARQDFMEKQRPHMFAGPHGLNAQRYYNVLCLAYGANSAMFDDVAPAGLPAWRAGDCGDEYALLKRAFDRLVLPHVDVAKQRAAIAQVRFNWSPLMAGAETLDKPPLAE
jgi:hypothetical protein